MPQPPFLRRVVHGAATVASDLGGGVLGQAFGAWHCFVANDRCIPTESPTPPR